MESNTGISPHIKTERKTRRMMLDVLVALFPATLFGISIFGLRALLVVAVSVASAVACEALFCYCSKIPLTTGDLSAAVTGLVLGLNLPPRLPLYMAAIGSAFAIIVVKMFFGGRGKNLLNPAAAARIFMLLAFSKAMTTFYEPFSDLVAEATPLAKDGTAFKELIFGVTGGTIGETSAVMLLFGGAYLVYRRVITLHVPLAFILTAGLIALCAGQNFVTAVCSGGLLLGAIFMATDCTTSPATSIGKIIFGIGLGVLTMVFRLFVTMPEGVSFSIVLMNFLVPVIDRFAATLPFGRSLGKESSND